MRKNYKQAALIALQNFDLDWTQIRFNQLSDNCTFVIETNKEGTFYCAFIRGDLKRKLTPKSRGWSF